MWLRGLKLIRGDQVGGIQRFPTGGEGSPPEHAALGKSELGISGSRMEGPRDRHAPPRLPHSVLAAHRSGAGCGAESEGVSDSASSGGSEGSSSPLGTADEQPSYKKKSAGNWRHPQNPPTPNS
eukprot:gene17128-biopygen6370